MSRVSKAILLAAEVHQDQVDKAGQDYILHCLAVMNMVDTSGIVITTSPYNREALLCTAVMHDVLEDYKTGLGPRAELRQHIYDTFGNRVYNAMDAITKQRHEEYDEYIGRVERDWIARRVKMADLRHNMDAMRLPSYTIGENDFERWDKYRRAYVRLASVE